MSRLNEFKQAFPENPVDGDTFTDDDGLQWVYGEEIKNWALNLQDQKTHELYTCLDDLPHGNSNSPTAIHGAKNVFRWLDENL